MMHKLQKNERGFSAVEALLIIIVVGLLAFGGWFVWHRHKTTTKPKSTTTTTSKTTTTTKKPPATKPAYAVPTGYKVYESKDLGFKFVYPTNYGDFTAKDTSTWASGTPNPVFVKGSTDGFSLSVLASADATFDTFKYGPSVGFVGNDLIVKTVNPADDVNHVGQPYQGFPKLDEPVKQIGGVAVHLINGGNEGYTYHKYAFLLNGKAITLQLPSFYDGTSVCGGASSCTANDQAPYDAFVQTVQQSITKL